MGEHLGCFVEECMAVLIGNVLERPDAVNSD